MHIKEKIINTKSYILILLLPAIVFYWLIPFYGELTIGNDYGIFSIQQQMELAYSQKNGSFPLYSPGFAEGRSSAALTMGQMYHPLSYLASSSPGYWDGDALSWNTFFRLLSLGFTHLIVFLLLRKLGLRRVTSFLISFITVYNLRILDLFRYGASLENHVGCLLLCSTLALYFSTTDKNRRTGGDHRIHIPARVRRPSTDDVSGSPGRGNHMRIHSLRAPFHRYKT